MLPGVPDQRPGPPCGSVEQVAEFVLPVRPEDGVRWDGAPSVEGPAEGLEFGDDFPRDLVLVREPALVDDGPFSASSKRKATMDSTSRWKRSRASASFLRVRGMRGPVYS